MFLNIPYLPLYFHYTFLLSGLIYCGQNALRIYVIIKNSKSPVTKFIKLYSHISVNQVSSQAFQKNIYLWLMLIFPLFIAALEKIFKFIPGLVKKIKAVI